MNGDNRLWALVVDIEHMDLAIAAIRNHIEWGTQRTPAVPPEART